MGRRCSPSGRAATARQKRGRRLTERRGSEEREGDQRELHYGSSWIVWCESKGEDP